MAELARTLGFQTPLPPCANTYGLLPVSSLLFGPPTGVIQSRDVPMSDEIGRWSSGLSRSFLERVANHVAASAPSVSREGCNIFQLDVFASELSSFLQQQEQDEFLKETYQPGIYRKPSKCTKPLR